ncbi:hypothetical protein LJPFL01_1230 [Lelliottia jeotgali]|jgi:hypothetical protein|nr:hypothetical protein LJPFL01_1230 [Lelliottia jeotgali]
MLWCDVNAQEQLRNQIRNVLSGWVWGIRDLTAAGILLKYRTPILRQNARGDQRGATNSALQPGHSIACFRRILDVGCEDLSPQCGQVTVVVDAPPMSFIA